MSRYTSSDSSALANLIASVLVILGFIPILFIVLAVSSILNGWVLSILWGWFISPVFGIPVITIGQAIGLAMVVNYLTYQHIDTNKERDDKTGYYATATVILLLRPIFTLGFGYLVHTFF